MRTSADLTESGVSEGSPRMSISSLALLLFAVIAAACGQLMLKYGMQAAATRAHHTGGSLVFAAVGSPWVLGGLAVFAVSAVAWLGVLSRIPLSIAYPFNALGYIAILTASIVILHERASLLTWAGSLLVVSGLLVVVLSKP
jgi:drug/metabolite transporter (DMT)-like permease